MKILRQDKVRFLIYAGILLVIIGIADDLYTKSLSYLHITLLFCLIFALRNSNRLKK